MFHKADVIHEVKEILLEQIDLQINDNRFSRQASAADDLFYADDGIVQSSLDNKEKKIDVVVDFLV